MEGGAALVALRGAVGADGAYEAASPRLREWVAVVGGGPGEPPAGGGDQQFAALSDVYWLGVLLIKRV